MNHTSTGHPLRDDHGGHDGHDELELVRRLVQDHRQRDRDSADAAQHRRRACQSTDRRQRWGSTATKPPSSADCLSMQREGSLFDGLPSGVIRDGSSAARRSAARPLRPWRLLGRLSVSEMRRVFGGSLAVHRSPRRLPFWLAVGPCEATVHPPPSGACVQCKATSLL